MASKAPAKKLSSFNAMIEQADALRVEIASAESALRLKKKDQDELEKRILDSMLESGSEVHRATGGGQFSIARTTVPSVADWRLVDAWILKNKAVDLLQRRLSVSAWREYVAAGKVVPSVVEETVVKLHYTKPRGE